MSADGGRDITGASGIGERVRPGKGAGATATVLRGPWGHTASDEVCCVGRGIGARIRRASVRLSATGCVSASWVLATRSES